MSVKDLKAIGLKTQRIIATGSNIPIVIYSSSIDSNGTGGVKDSNLLSSVGSDTFIFISGSKDSKDTNTKGVSLFGGDVVVSGTLYAERQVIEVDQTSPGALFVSGNLEVTGTTLLNSNRTNNTEFVFSAPNKEYAARFRSDNETIYFLSGGAASDHNEAEYQDTNFFVSGSIGSAHQPTLGQTGNGERGTGVFGGDLFVSGNMFAGNNLTIEGDLTVLGNQPDGLKSYDENGDFLQRPKAAAIDAITIGKDSLNESTSSIVMGFQNTSSMGLQSLDILGGFNNTLINGNHSAIIAGSNNRIDAISETSVDFNLLIGGDGNRIFEGSVVNTIINGNNNIITSSADGVTLIGSDGAVIKSKGFYGFADNLEIGEKSRDSIVLGPENIISASDGKTANKNTIIGRKINILNSGMNFAFGQPILSKDIVTIKDTNKSFVHSNSELFVSSSESIVAFASNLTASNINNSFIHATNGNVYSSDYVSLLNSNLSHISSSNYTTIISSKNSDIQHADIAKLNLEKLNSGIPNATLTLTPGYNAIISSETSKISGSYSVVLGGFLNNISASMSSIYGGFNNKIINEVSNSYSIGGNNNEITNDNVVVVGSNNTVSNKNNFVIGKGLSSNLENSVLIGFDQNSIANSKFILSSSMFEFGDLNTPKLYGVDTNFFVSGAIDSKNTTTRGTAVFGGDVHISGTLSGGGFIVDDLFFEGGDAKARPRSLGSTDNSAITLITNNEPRIKLESSNNITVGTGSVFHITTGSIDPGTFEFNSSLDKTAAFNYPFVISRTSPNDGQNFKEVGMAFISYPGTPDVNFSVPEDAILNNEPGAAITFFEQGPTSKGGLKFKTKTTKSQITLKPIPEEPSLTTKLKITNLGELLLGNDNPDLQYIDLRVSGSAHPLISASGSNDNDRHVYLMKNDVNQTDTNFYVKGIIDSKKNNTKGTAVFGGDVHVSGSLYTDGDHTLDGNLIIGGDVNSSNGNIEITADSNTKITLDATGPVDSDGIIIETNRSHIVLDPAESVGVQGDVVVVGDQRINSDLNVLGNITGSHIKGSGVEISNVNLSSLWRPIDETDSGEKIPTAHLGLKFSGFIDGNTGLFRINYEQFQKDIIKLFKGELPEEDFKWQILESQNTRLYDTYWEMARNLNGEVIVRRETPPGSDNWVPVALPISTERIPSDDQVIIKAK